MGGVDLQQQWEAVKAAPVLYIGALLVLAGVIWWVVNHLKTNQIESLKGRLKLRDDEIADYKRKAGATPDLAAARIEALEKQVASILPPRLTPEQKRTLIDALKKLPRSDIGVVAENGATEIMPLARDIRAVFTDAGWGGGRSVGVVFGPHYSPPSGLLLFYAPAVADIGRRISAAFRDAGIDVGATEAETLLGQFSFQVALPHTD